MSKKIIILIIAVVAIAFSVYYFKFIDKNYQDIAKNLKVSHLIYNPDKILSSFSLIDHNGNNFNNESLKGEWTLLVFIYTHCPDVCPTELMNISLVNSKIRKNNPSLVPNVVAITFDPLRDTPEVLKTFVTHYDADFVGVSGDQNQIDQLVKDFGAYYERVVNGENGVVIVQNYEPLPSGALENGYLINHTAWIYLINPDGQIYAGFPTPHKPNDMAEDIKILIDSY